MGSCNVSNSIDILSLAVEDSVPPNATLFGLSGNNLIRVKANDIQGTGGDSYDDTEIRESLNALTAGVGSRPNVYTSDLWTSLSATDQRIGTRPTNRTGSLWDNLDNVLSQVGEPPDGVTETLWEYAAATKEALDTSNDNMATLSNSITTLSDDLTQLVANNNTDHAAIIQQINTVNQRVTDHLNNLPTGNSEPPTVVFGQNPEW
jgi:hypothetical protein